MMLSFGNGLIVDVELYHQVWQVSTIYQKVADVLSLKQEHKSYIETVPIPM
jgi:hypothetical protein